MHARYAVKCPSQMYPYKDHSMLHFLMTSAFWLHLRVISLPSARFLQVDSAAALHGAAMQPGARREDSCARPNHADCS